MQNWAQYLSGFLKKLRSDLVEIKDEIKAANLARQAKEKEEPADPPILRAELNAPQAVIDEIKTYTKGAEDRDSKRDRRDRLRLFVEGTGILIAVFLVIIAKGQWDEMREATVATRRAAEAAQKSADTAEKVAKDTVRALDIAQEQVDAAKRSVEISRESLQSVQRAFVNFAAFRINRVVLRPGENRWEFTPTYENNGATPAINVLTDFKADKLKEEPDDSTFLRQSASTDRPITYIGPRATQAGGSYFIKESTIFGRDFGQIIPNASGIQTVDGYVFLWGWIAYRDVFPNTKLHVTEFCGRIGGVKVAESGKTEFMIASCKDHNCTDEHCKNYPQMLEFLSKAN